MSVLSCARFGCTNVMCDYTILDGTAYICASCREELDAWFRGLDHSLLCVREEDGPNTVREAIKEFMDSSKQARSNRQYPEIMEEFRRLMN